MEKKVFDAERNEVRAAVIVLILALSSIVAGLSQVMPSIAHAQSGCIPTIPDAAHNLERR